MRGFVGLVKTTPAKEFMEVVEQLGLYWLVLNNPPPEIESKT